MLFSIIIPCLNRPNELRAAIQSCLDQTYSDFELIVIDDGSTPPLSGICNSFNDARILYHRNPKNIGVSGSRNIGIDLATGTYVSFLDSDDIYLPRRLEVLSQTLERTSPAPAIVFHRQKRIVGGDADNIATPERLPTLDERLDQYILVWGNFIQTNTFIVERNLAKKVKFDVGCNRHEDTKFVLECWLRSPTYFACGDVLSVYHDFAQMQRLSKQEGFDHLRPLLDFAERHCSTKAYHGFAGYAAAELRFFKHASHVTAMVFRAYRSGVPGLRCTVYLARSALGTGLVDRTIQLLRLAYLRWSRR